MQKIDSVFKLPLEQRPFNPNWIDKVEIRTETDEFDLARQRYALRLSPNTSKIRKAQGRLQQLYQAEAQVDLLQQKENFVEAVYEDLLQAYEDHRKVALERELLRLLMDKEKIVEKLLLNGDATPRNWLDLKRNISDLDIKIHQRENSLSQYDDLIDWSDWTNVQALVQQLKTTTMSLPLDPQIEMQLVDSEIALERAEQHRWFDFLQLDYNGDPDDVWQQKASVTAAVVLPFSGNRKLKLEELAIEKEKLTLEKTLQQAGQQLEITQIKNEIFALWEQLTYARQRQKDLATENEALLQRLAQSENYSPLLMLEERSEQLKTALDNLDLEMEIYDLYLELLVESGVLFGESSNGFFQK